MFPLVQAGILQSSNYLPILPYLTLEPKQYLLILILLLHRPKGSLAEFPKKTRHMDSGRFYAWCKHGRYWGGMSIADKKSTHHHHHYQSVAGHDHHHQTVLSSERERGPDDSDEEGYSRLLTFPHPISITIPYLTCMYMLLANRKISNGPYIPRRCSTREGAGGREGGREEGRESEGRGRVRFRVVLSLALFFLEGGFLAFTVFCFLFGFLVS